MTKRIKLPSDETVKKVEQSLKYTSRRAEELERRVTRERPKEGVDGEFAARLALGTTQLAINLAEEYAKNKADKDVGQFSVELNKYYADLNKLGADEMTEAINNQKAFEMIDNFSSKLDYLSDHAKEDIVTSLRQKASKANIKAVLRSVNKGKQEFKQSFKTSLDELRNELSNDPKAAVGDTVTELEKRIDRRFSGNSKLITAAKESIAKTRFLGEVDGLANDQKWDELKEKLETEQSNKYLSAYEKSRYLEVVRNRNSRTSKYSSLKKKLRDFDIDMDATTLIGAAAAVGGGTFNAVSGYVSAMSQSARENKPISIAAMKNIERSVDLGDDGQREVYNTLRKKHLEFNKLLKLDPLLVARQLGGEDVANQSHAVNLERYGRVTDNVTAGTLWGRVKAATMSGPEENEKLLNTLVAQYGNRELAERAITEAKNIGKQMDKAGTEEEVRAADAVAYTINQGSVGINAVKAAQGAQLKLPNKEVPGEWLDIADAFPKEQGEEFLAAVRSEATFTAKSKVDAAARDGEYSLNSKEYKEALNEEYNNTLRGKIETYRDEHMFRDPGFFLDATYNDLGVGGKSIYMPNKEAEQYTDGIKHGREFMNDFNSDFLGKLNTVVSSESIRDLNSGDWDTRLVTNGYGFDVYVENENGIIKHVKTQDGDNLHLSKSEIYEEGLSLFDKYKTPSREDAEFARADTEEQVEKITGKTPEVKPTYELKSIPVSKSAKDAINRGVKNGTFQKVSDINVIKDSWKGVDLKLSDDKLYNLTRAFAVSTINAESRFDAKASSGVAQGIAQITAPTWKDFAKEGEKRGQDDIKVMMRIVNRNTKLALKQARKLSNKEFNKLTLGDIFKTSAMIYNAGPDTKTGYASVDTLRRKANKQRHSFSPRKTEDYIAYQKAVDAGSKRPEFPGLPDETLDYVVKIFSPLASASEVDKLPPEYLKQLSVQARQRRANQRQSLIDSTSDILSSLNIDVDEVSKLMNTPLKDVYKYANNT